MKKLDLNAIKKSYDKASNASKSEAQKFLEKNGTQFDNDGNIVVDLMIDTDNGKKNFGKISYDAYKAIEGGNLDSYQPKNDEENNALTSYRKESIIPLKTKDGKEFGKISYNAYNAIINNDLNSYTPKDDKDCN